MTLGPIIIVEDNPDDLFFLERAMHKLQKAPSVLMCRDGVDAIELLLKLKHSGEPMPMAIVTDLKMPLKTGFDLLQWRREHDWARQIPMVILSSSDLLQDQERASALGASAYYVKPKNADNLVSTFSEIINRHCGGARPTAGL